MVNVDPHLIAIYEVFEFSGIFLMGVMGGLIAREREYDLFGFILIALVSALGGGMIRDSLIMEGAVSAVAEPKYLLVACAGALVAFVTRLHGRVWELFRVHADAVVLGVWAVTGASKSLALGLSPHSAVFMGLLTAVGGGILADLLTGRTPQVLLGKRLYAAPAFIAALVMVGLHMTGNTAWGMIIGPVLAAVLAIGSYWFNWRIPFHVDFAPVNVVAGEVRKAVSPLEEQVRGVARENEPKGMRALRHKALEKAQDEVDMEAADVTAAADIKAGERKD